MTINVQLTPGSNNPKWPDHVGDGAKIMVEFPFDETFYEMVSMIHDASFNILFSGKTISCVLNQGGTPISLIFPDKDASPPIVSMKLLVYCSLEEILEIKQAKSLVLSI